MTRIPNIAAGFAHLARDPTDWPRSNLWYNDDHFEVYARSTVHLIRALGRSVRTLDLANFSVTDPQHERSGLMREMFELAEATVAGHPIVEAVYVENVLNEEALLPFLQGRGYKIAALPEWDHAASCWYKMLPE